MSNITDKEAQHLHRLILFSDAVFAIAITLLAIEIHPPEGWTGEDVAVFFRLMGTKLSAYAVSFVVVGVLWISHRRTFSRLVKADGVLDVVNFLMLGLVALLPLGTEMLWHATHGGALLIYVGLVTAIGLAQGLTWGYAAFVGKLTEPIALATRVLILVRVTLLPGLCCGLTFVSLVTGTPWGFVAIGVLMWGMSLLARRLQPRDPQSGAA
uniref:Integral membrane protein n=1 Tax=Caulobacter sp. (strain K31) TaxID=366602 RepID=B0T200_CAUSK